MKRVKTEDSNSVDIFVNALKNNQIIAYPTDTIYGLGTDINNNEGIDRINSIKMRKQPMSVALGSFEIIKNNINAEEDILIKIEEILKDGSTCIVKYNPGSLNVQHSHPGCDLSGVLWIKCPNQCGNILFYSPSCFETFQEIESYTQDFKDNNNYHHNYWFPPIEGRMIIFPSHLQHEVKKNLSNEDRISASFNIKLENKKIVWLE